MFKLCTVALLAALFGLNGAAHAQAYPNKPIRVIIPFAAAGPADIIGRLAGQKLSEALGQPVVIDNRGGAGGNVGTAAAAKSPADGYTVLITSSAFAVNVTLSPNAGFDPLQDFIPVAVIAKQPNLIFVHPSVPAKTLAELLALGKTRKLAFGTPGSGTTPHLTAENLFNLDSKLDMTPIHFRGAGLMIAGVAAGEPSVGSGAISGPLALVKAGRLRPLAVSSATRVPTLPEVPTFAESGFPGVTDETWIAVFVPTGTPPAVVQRLNDAVNQMLKAPDVLERLAAVAFEPVGGTPAQFSAYLKTEITKWGKVVRDGKITAE